MDLPTALDDFTRPPKLEDEAAREGGISIIDSLGREIKKNPGTKNALVEEAIIHRTALDGVTRPPVVGGRDRKGDSTIIDS